MAFSLNSSLRLTDTVFTCPVAPTPDTGILLVASTLPICPVPETPVSSLEGFAFIVPKEVVPTTLDKLSSTLGSGAFTDIVPATPTG